MPLPRGLARLNRRVTNRITRPFARRLPGFGVLRHVGRRTGREYQTPLNAWKTDVGVVVALTYGPEVDWLRNARASNGTSIIMAGEVVELGLPQEISTGEGMGAVPASVRWALRRLGVTEFVRFPRIG